MPLDYEKWQETIRDLTAMRRERDEADRRAGAAERELAGLREDLSRLSRVRDEQKREAGYSVNVSWDIVWADTIAAAKALKGEPIDCIGGDVLPPLGQRVLIHLGREDQWVEHTVVGYYVWPPMCGPGLRVFVRVRHPGGSLNARLLKDVRKLDGTPFLKDTDGVPAKGGDS